MRYNHLFEVILNQDELLWNFLWDLSITSWLENANKSRFFCQAKISKVKNEEYCYWQQMLCGLQWLWHPRHDSPVPELNCTGLSINSAEIVLCLTQIGHALLWRDGAVLHHHLHKVDKRLHDGDQCLSLLGVLICNGKPENRSGISARFTLIGHHGVNATTWCSTVVVVKMGL